MNELGIRYIKYLVKLTSKELIKQLQVMQMKKTAPFNKKKLIRLLASADPLHIQQRISELAIPISAEGSNSSAQNKQSVSNIDRFYSSQIIQMRQKLTEVKNKIYLDLSAQFQKTYGVKQQTPAKIDFFVNNQTSLAIDQNQHYHFDEKPYITVPRLNLFMNARTSIELPSDSIKYEYQENVLSLVKSIFSQQSNYSIKNLRNKERKFSKAQLGGLKMKGELIENLIMLYGLQKEEELEQNLIDPLQKLLHDKKLRQNAIKNYLANLTNRITQRRDYYEQILVHLPIQKLLNFTNLALKIRELELVSQVIKNKTLLLLSQSMLQNKDYLQQSQLIAEKQKLKKLSEQGVSQNLKLIFQLQLWVLKHLQNFVLDFQSEYFTKQNFLNICQSLSAYHRIKQKMRKIIEQRYLSISTSKQQFFSSFLQQINIKQLLRLQQMLQAREADQFYEKFFQIIVFLDVKKQIQEKQLQIYTPLLKTLFQFNTQVPAHIFRKVIDDHMIILNKLMAPQFVEESHAHLFTEFLVKNIEKPITNDEAKVVSKIIWQNIFQKYEKNQEMTFVQGKYFVMALHLISSYSKKHPEIIKEIVKDTILIKVFEKYSTMITKNKEQFDNLNKNIIFQHLASAFNQLLKQDEKKNEVIELLESIKLDVKAAKL